MTGALVVSNPETLMFVWIWPAGMKTETGKETLSGDGLDKVMVSPPSGAGEETVTAVVWMVPGDIFKGFGTKEIL
jgi:hypothetical protein